LSLSEHVDYEMALKAIKAKSGTAAFIRKPIDTRNGRFHMEPGILEHESVRCRLPRVIGRTANCLQNHYSDPSESYYFILATVCNNNRFRSDISQPENGRASISVTQKRHKELALSHLSIFISSL